MVGESLSRGMCILVAPNAALCQHFIASVALGNVVRLRKVFKVGHATTQPLVHYRVHACERQVCFHGG
jgi:hypothetical protein